MLFVDSFVLSVCYLYRMLACWLDRWFVAMFFF